MCKHIKSRLDNRKDKQLLCSGEIRSSELYCLVILKCIKKDKKNIIR